MFTRYLCLLLMMICGSVNGQSLNRLAPIDFDQSDFYLLDVFDNNVRAFPSVDAYRYEGKLYIAITPLFEGLRVKYSLVNNIVTVMAADKAVIFELQATPSENGQWFNDGSFIFIQSNIIEALFDTKITVDSNLLKMDLIGHSIDFPYRTIQNQQSQRKLKNYIIEDPNQENSKEQSRVITIQDQYRLATVPTGFASFEYSANNANENYDLALQTISDLAYHSANITLVQDEQETNSRVLFSRYPQYTGDKILGIWDQYSFGDIWLRKSSLAPGSSRGLGIDLSANLSDNFSENMTTSFTKTARPDWDADVYHNGRFLESRVVPADGLLEFNNLEVFYGSNEFKIVLYGPYGEQETLLEKVNVRSNPLGQGDLSYGLSLKENDSSLLDIDLPEFNIDDIAAYLNVGLFDNWQLGLGINLNDIHNPTGKSETYLINNQVTFPGWFFQNQLAINESFISQKSSLATSVFNNDSLTVRYNSQWQDGSAQRDNDTSNFDAAYNFKFGSVTHNVNYNYDQFASIKNERLNYRLNYFNRYFNLSNTLSYIRKNKQDDLAFGALSLATRVNNDFRLVANIPYDINGSEAIDPDRISASALYNYRAGEYNHAFSVSNRSFFKNNLWSVGYNLAINKPTHQFTLRTLYNSKDQWSVSAGITINFAYDYFNNVPVFSSQPLGGYGSIDVHTYLDRQLNGIPDVLDYNLADVRFSGGPNWENIMTNEEGRARLFGANSGITALSAFWNENSGGQTLNNDYLIYSHPGSLQRVNLPFYLSTEVELFVILNNDSQAVTLRNVPLIAKNISTGDEYAIETDLDGYANFVGLFPGKYQIFVDPNYLTQKGMQTVVAGFEFNSPLSGGFIVLPNIELKRSDSIETETATETNTLIKITLDENNYVPLLNTDNDKLIHLPPKGAIKAPYSSDHLDRAIFKEIKTQSTEQERRELRSKLLAAADSSQSFQSSLTQLQYPSSAGTIIASSQDAPEVFETEQEGTKSVNQLNTAVVLSPFIPESVVRDQVLPSSLDDNVLALDNNIIQADETLDLSSGYVIQYSALKSLAIAKALTETFPNTVQLHIVRKLVNGDSYYCIVSQVFQDQNAATSYLKTAEKDGFIVAATNYLEPIWSK